MFFRLSSILSYFSLSVYAFVLYQSVHYLLPFLSQSRTVAAHRPALSPGVIFLLLSSPSSNFYLPFRFLNLLSGIFSSCGRLSSVSLFLFLCSQSSTCGSSVLQGSSSCYAWCRSRTRHARDRLAAAFPARRGGVMQSAPGPRGGRRQRSGPLATAPAAVPRLFPRSGALAAAAVRTLQIILDIRAVWCVVHERPAMRMTRQMVLKQPLCR